MNLIDQTLNTDHLDNLKLPHIISKFHKGFLRLDDVLARIPVGKSTWWAGVKTGRYPQPIKLTPRLVGWRVEEIEEYIQNPNSRKNWLLNA